MEIKWKAEAQVMASTDKGRTERNFFFSDQKRGGKREKQEKNGAEVTDRKRQLKIRVKNKRKTLNVDENGRKRAEAAATALTFRFRFVSNAPLLHPLKSIQLIWINPTYPNPQSNPNQLYRKSCLR